MSFSYQGHYKYMNLAGELEGSITNTLGYNMMEMQARSQEALEVMMQQHHARSARRCARRWQISAGEADWATYQAQARQCTSQSVVCYYMLVTG